METSIKPQSEFNIQDLLSVDLPGVTGEEIIVYEKLELQDVISHPDDRIKDLLEDYKFVRETIRFQRQMLMNMAPIALENAKNSENPKTVEAFAKVMAEMTANNVQLMRLHKEIKEIINEPTKTTAATGDNPTIHAETVFIGTPADIMNKVGTQQDSYNLRDRE